MSPELTIWDGVGWLGQAFFSGRFLVQWIQSERRKSSILPTVFWWLSIGGSLCLLSYAIYRQDPVIIAGQSAGFIVYSRNLVIRSREKRAASDAAI